jgi:hypothetical protein
MKFVLLASLAMVIGVVNATHDRSFRNTRNGGCNARSRISTSSVQSAFHCIKPRDSH